MSEDHARTVHAFRHASKVEAFARIGFLCLLPVIVYLTTKPGPAIVEERWIPRTAAKWFDLHDGWKNLAGFGALGWLAFMGWPGGIRQSVALQIALLCALVTGLEFLQLAIPTRVFDVSDIINGSAGILISFCTVLVTRRFLGTVKTGLR
ncbi:MAG TPA: VanZ family protein [Roseimicrobium sp.]|nr:VanZ family protein [Roseimicrobium sp.]